MGKYRATMVPDAADFPEVRRFLQRAVFEIAAAINDSVATLDDLSDVVITAAATNDLLQFDGTNWVDVAKIAYGNLPSGDGTWDIGSTKRTTFPQAWTFGGGTFQTSFDPTLSGVSTLMWDILAASSASNTNIGYRVQVGANAGVALPNSYGLQVLTPSLGGGASITTSYGLKIEDQTGPTTAYAIYTGTGAVSFGDILI